MIFGVNTIVSNFTRLTAREITYNNSEMSLVVFMPNITTNRAITYTYLGIDGKAGPPFSSFNTNACKSHRKHYYG